MKRKHCQKSRMNGRFCKILRESSKKRENIFVGVSSCAKGQKRVFCSGSAEKSSKKVVEIFGSLVKSPYFCTRFRERNPGARVQGENYINEEDRKIRYSVCFLR